MKKTILITGGNKGIGFETARQLGKTGNRIIVSGRNQNKVEKAVTILRDQGIDAEPLMMDVSDRDSIRIAAKEISSRNIMLDVLINNAGILDRNDHNILQEHDVLQQTIATNSLGALWVCRALLPLMNNPARIINVSSGAGSMSDPIGGWSPAYCVSKTMLNALTRHLAYELKSKNISVNAVCPGWVQTDMGGMNATRPVEKGAETIVWLAESAPQQYTGKIFRDRKETSW